MGLAIGVSGVFGSVEECDVGKRKEDGGESFEVMGDCGGEDFMESLDGDGGGNGFGVVFDFDSKDILHGERVF